MGRAHADGREWWRYQVKTLDRLDGVQVNLVIPIPKMDAKSKPGSRTSMDITCTFCRSAYQQRDNG